MLRLRPEDAAAADGLGDALALEGRVAEAAEQFAAASRLAPEGHRSRMRLGHMLVALGREAEAARAFEGSAALSRGGFQAPLLMGLMRELGGDDEGARDAYRDGLRRCPQSSRPEVEEMLGPLAFGVSAGEGEPGDAPVVLALPAADISCDFCTHTHAPYSL